MSLKIPDYFGEYIGGARRDDWRSDGLNISHLDAMNQDELKKYVKKDSVWPLPNAVKVVENGAQPFVVYWARYIRRMASPYPITSMWQNFTDASKTYIRSLRDLRKCVEEVKCDDDIVRFYDVLDQQDFQGCISIYQLKDSKHYLSILKRKCERENFPYGNRKKETAKKSRTRFVVSQLEHINRCGQDYRNGMHITPASWQKTFQFRGVEFGNWTNQNDRQASLDHAFDALKDLGSVLGIEDTDIAFCGKLALAFGSRGRTKAAAHFEPERKVINLTKMHGAGSTAHEWFHALDNSLAEYYGITDTPLASITHNRKVLPEYYKDLLRAMERNENGTLTDFYVGSMRFDKHFSRDSFGYWSSKCEMAARAFACYIKDMLCMRDCVSDYLVAHADAYFIGKGNECFAAIPRGKERERINQLFDQMFMELKKVGFFHERTLKPDLEDEAKLQQLLSNEDQENIGKPVILSWDDSGQMMFG